MNKIEAEKAYPFSTIVASEPYDAVIQFLENLSEAGFVLCEKDTESSRGQYSPTLKSPDKITQDYFGVDARDLEAERRRMLRGGA